MRPAIGGFHIFHALRLAVMPSPYITEITPEMQQKIRIFAEKGVPTQKSQKRTSLPPPKVNPRCPLQGAGIRAAGRPPYRRASEPPDRFGGSAAGPAGPPAARGDKHPPCSRGRPGRRPCRPPHPRTTPPPTQGEGCVKGEPLRCPLRVQSGQGLPLCTRYALPPAPAKKTPFGVFFAGAADGN